MARINVYSYDDEGGKTLDGWFDTSRAEDYREDSRWNGNSHIGIESGIDHRFGGEWLYRTQGGRWVRHRDTKNYFHGPETFEFIAAEAARDWLMRNDHDDVVAKHFGEIEEERGPGRPEVGKPINVRLGDDLLLRVDAEADRRGKSRADTLRELVTSALQAAATQQDAVNLTNSPFGVLTDYTTGEELRAATADEHGLSLAAGETGAFEIDGRVVFVAGGPEDPVE
jgi:hypothetical protein